MKRKPEPAGYAVDSTIMVSTAEAVERRGTALPISGDLLTKNEARRAA